MKGWGNGRDVKGQRTQGTEGREPGSREGIQGNEWSGGEG